MTPALFALTLADPMAPPNRNPGGRPPRLDADRTNLSLPRSAKRRAMAEARRRGVSLAVVVAECIERMLGGGGEEQAA